MHIYAQVKNCEWIETLSHLSRNVLLQMHTEKFNEKSLNDFLAKSSIAVALKCCCCKDTHSSYFLLWENIRVSNTYHNYLSSFFSNKPNAHNWYVWKITYKYSINKFTVCLPARLKVITSIRASAQMCWAECVVSIRQSFFTNLGECSEIFVYNLVCLKSPSYVCASM